MRNRLTMASVFILTVCAVLSAQEPPPAPVSQPPQPSTVSMLVEASGESATLTYFNRQIVVLRARVVGRSPAQRVAIGVKTLEDLVASGRTRPVETQEAPGAIIVGVGRSVIVVLTPMDIDQGAGETLEGVARDTVARVQQALDEAADSRRVGVWLRGAALGLAALVGAAFVLGVLGRIKRRALTRLSALTTATVERLGLGDQHAGRVATLLGFFESRFISFLFLVLQFTVLYWLVMFTLRLFPYSRPWGESLRGFLVATIGNLARNVANEVPAIVTIVIILSLTRFVIKLIEPWFDAVERGSIKVRWVHPETAVTTRRLVTVCLWLFSAAVVYPYVPGSDTDAFRGISIFVGLMVTLGSSGLVNQVMSGFMLTYSRALRTGDYVRIGEVEGTITHLGVLSTKLRTVRSEDVTIPNAVVVSQTTTDYSRFPDAVVTPTSVTIGYDAPWRQVHALLLQAAERTSGIRREPEPRVPQTALEGSAVRYTLIVCLERQDSRFATFSALHANIQDLFNEHGVQIMTPNYEGDPESPKLVKKQDWFAAPAPQDATTDRRSG